MPERSARKARFNLVRSDLAGRTRKFAAALTGIAVFILALQLLKASASGLGGLLAGIGVESPLHAFGFGWLFAYVVLSGSPVAAIALSLFGSEVITALQTFTMIAGSRFGASFIVLLLGFVYLLRGKPLGRSLEMGVLSLLTTYVVYGIAVPLGALLLASGSLDGFRLALPASVFDLIGAVYDPVVATLDAVLPRLLLFGLGVAGILLAFKLFDLALPDLAEESPIRGLEAHVFKPTVMFALGGVITLFTMSVSVSLGLLVPLSAKGVARRENVIPYIMGANITTFVDTLLASLLIEKPQAFVVVLVEMLSVAMVSAIILIFFYNRFERALLALSKRILATRAGLAVFVVAIFLIPLLLLVL